MAEGIYVLTASGALSKYQKQITDQTTKTKEQIRKILPIPETDIIFEDNPNGAIFHLGIGGYTPNAHLVQIFLNPKFPDLEISLEKELPRLLAHELYHALRWLNPGYGQTLLEALVSEGLADHFDIEFTGEPPQKWDEALTPEEIEKFQKIAKEEYDNKDYNHTEWFFGLDIGNTPRWTGYTLGFKLIADYLEKHPDKKPSQLYNLPARDFLD